MSLSRAIVPLIVALALVLPRVECAPLGATRACPVGCGGCCGERSGE
ncbi:MAG: hypothetical protein AB7K52_09175 [Phycisphaerales bacterium]